jgi:hypothetical protein
MLVPAAAKALIGTTLDDAALAAAAAACSEAASPITDKRGTDRLPAQGGRRAVPPRHRHRPRPGARPQGLRSRK